MDILWSDLVDWEQGIIVGIKLILTLLISLPIAWNREKNTRSMGLRTFPLVAVASCSYILIVLSVAEGNPDTQGRVLQGLLTGIGFIGGGAILKQENGVSGTATAASIWATGSIGAAVGFGRLDIALLVMGLTFAVLRIFTQVGEKID
jgi:putative Mg2+ transporter-C (MgtC) family protein